MPQELKITTDFFYRKGFTINMAHYTTVAAEITRDKYIINGKSKLKVYVDSNYALGYFFGAFVSVGISDLPSSNYVGQVLFYTDGTKDLSKLYDAVDECFGVSHTLQEKPNGRLVVVIYCKPLAKLMKEFGRADKRHLPSKYLVNNKEYLKGLLQGIEDFDGHLPDTRKVVNPRKLSLSVVNLHTIITNILKTDSNSLL